MIRLIKSASVVLSCGTLVGCATPKSVDSAALAAAAQLDELHSSVATMVKEHNAYIDDSAKLTNDEIDMLREIDILEFLSDNKEPYVASLSSAPEATVTKTLPAFASSTLAAWKARQTARNEQRERLLQMQEDAADKIALDFKRLRDLRSKLNALATPRTDKESMKFIAAYLKEVDKELDKLKEEATETND